MTFIIAYVTVLAVFGVLDGIWLSQMVDILYRPMLGDMLAERVRVAPAIAFYLFFPIGIVVFAVLPAVRATSLLVAIGYGALLGALCYATYDLTNYATLKNWTLYVTAIDIVYGAVTSAVCAAAALIAIRAVVDR